MTVVAGGILRFFMVFGITLCFVVLGFRFLVILSKVFSAFVSFFFGSICGSFSLDLRDEI